MMRGLARALARPMTLLALLLVVLAIVGGALLALTAERVQEQARAEALRRTELRAAQLADALAGEVQALLSGFDLALLHLRREWQIEREGFDERARAIQSVLPAGALNHVTVIDAQGFSVY
ncbi:MAG: hypothetical protein IT500_01005, partial [Rubrivivax sp.]|nr:hypothetical protein [Rubrivivax sp.]